MSGPLLRPVPRPDRRQASRNAGLDDKKGTRPVPDRVPRFSIDPVPSGGRHTARPIRTRVPVERTEYVRE